MWASPEAYLRVEHLEGDSLWWVLAIPSNITLVFACQGQTLWLIMNIHKLLL
jgi:hypothetical protein